MTVQRLHSGLAPIDVLTRSDLEAMRTQHLEEAMRVKLRGIDYIEVNGNANGASQISIPGPFQGYAWSIKIISAVVSAADTLSAYLGDNTSTAPVGQVVLAGAGAAIMTFTSNIVIVRDGRNITLATVTGSDIGAYKILAKEVPNEMIGKL